MYSNKYICSKLKELEKEYNVTILFAVEAGSHAYGLDSVESNDSLNNFFRYVLREAV